MCLDSIMQNFDYLSLFFAGLLETTCNLVLFLNFVTFSRLAKEQELLEFKKKAEEMEKENLELATQLAKKEAELDVKTQVNNLSCSLHIFTKTNSEFLRKKLLWSFKFVVTKLGRLLPQSNQIQR